MYINQKEDIVKFMNLFKEFAKWDPKNEKHCFTFEDNFRKGTWILMLANGQWSIRGEGNKYIDIEEIYISRKEAEQFIWENRLPISKLIEQTT